MRHILAHAGSGGGSMVARANVDWGAVSYNGSNMVRLLNRPSASSRPRLGNPLIRVGETVLGRFSCLSHTGGPVAAGIEGHTTGSTAELSAGSPDQVGP